MQIHKINIIIRLDSNWSKSVKSCTGMVKYFIELIQCRTWLLYKLNILIIVPLLGHYIIHINKFISMRGNKIRFESSCIDSNFYTI